MTYQRKHRKASFVPVQMNIRVPFAYRDFLTAEARRRRTSVNKLVVETLTKHFPHPSLTHPDEFQDNGEIE